MWDWAAEADPTQPLTVGAYLFPDSPAPWAVSPVARTALERSDVVSFHCYGGAPVLERTIDVLSALGRPLVCTEWMARPTSPVELVEVLRRREVGAFTWGLVDGRSQTRYPWTSHVRRTAPDRPWFHDLLHPDGTPYDAGEAATLRRAAGVGLG